MYEIINENLETVIVYASSLDDLFEQYPGALYAKRIN